MNLHRPNTALRAAIIALSVLHTSCGTDEPLSPPPAPPQVVDLRLNELVTNNEGVWLDESGEADDYLELYNASSEILNLGNYAIEESSGQHTLPAHPLAPGESALLWADDQTDQGPLHLPFKLSSSGETLVLIRQVDGVEVDRAPIPALAEHHAWLRVPDGFGHFVDCGWASPGRSNGDHCGPVASVAPPEQQFAPYTWPTPWPPLPSPLVITELALRPAGFVELQNLSDSPVELSAFFLHLAAHPVGTAWPDTTSGSVLPWPQPSLGGGERVVIPVTSADTEELSQSPSYEGVVTLWKAESPAPTPVDRVDFVEWPEGASLARAVGPGSNFRFCTEPSPGQDNSGCNPLPSRTVGDHLRSLQTPGDFSALASGRHELGIEAVEFVIDMMSGDVVYLLDASHWELHYVFVREAINRERHLNRCDPRERSIFNQGWYAFSASEYFKPEGRRYLLGTLVHHAGSGLHTVEFTPGDAIRSDQIEHAFFAVMQHVDDPTRWALRPQSPAQREVMQQIEGRVPLVDIDAPFRGQTFQALVQQVGYGTLRYVPADAIDTTPLGPQDILITDQVPNNIPLIGGLITESFQTPLAHVAVLSRGRGTPNMALRDAREDPRISPLLGELVRLEISGPGFTLTAADPTEALAFWDSRKPQGLPQSPRLDTSVRGVQPLQHRSLADLPSIGGKAAQMAELARVEFCEPSTQTPPQPFAVPIVHSLEHYAASGAAELLSTLREDPAFRADPRIRDQGLAQVRARILAHPVEPVLLAEVSEAISSRWPGLSVRFRSSSNTEDLAGFNGAGLYESVSAASGDGAGGIANALRTVWASLMARRAYDEREYYSIDPSAVGMGVLVHPAFPAEQANGVGISRDALNPTRGDRVYINAQRGEALVTNPAPGITSDEIIYDPSRAPFAHYQTRSNLTQGQPVLSESELRSVACNLGRIHEYFLPRLDPEQANPWFAMDVEFKLVGPERRLVVKQARPYSFGAEAPSGWCDF